MDVLDSLSCDLLDMKEIETLLQAGAEALLSVWEDSFPHPQNNLSFEQNLNNLAFQTIDSQEGIQNRNLYLHESRREEGGNGRASP
jgi:hypothetical protein